MANPFDTRERAAEGIYVQDQQLQFLARRRGIEAAAVWAADSMGLSSEDKSRYALQLIDAFVAGTSEDRLVSTIQTDLERAGKPALSTHAGTVLAQAVADATIALRGHPEPSASSQTTDPRTEWERHHHRPDHRWGWGL